MPAALMPRLAGLLMVGYVIAASGCMRHSVVGSSGKPGDAEPDASPRAGATGANDGDSAIPQQPKQPSLITAKAGEGLGMNNPIVGDVDGDGYDDFLIQGTLAGLFGDDRPRDTNIHLFYGAPSLAHELSTADAAATFHAGQLGVFPLGDINGDELADFSLGHDRGFEIVLGSSTRFLGDYSAMAAGMTWTGQKLPQREDGVMTLLEVRAAGDVNGDGMDDLLVGASAAPPDDGTGSRPRPQYAVTQYLVLGHQGLWASGEWDPSWAAAEFGWAPPRTVDASTQESAYPLSVQPAGDLDGDGYADLIARGGPAYVFYGGPDRFAGVIGVEEADAVVAALELASPIGPSVGDLDGDGCDDLVSTFEPGTLTISHGSRQRWSGSVGLERAVIIKLEHSSFSRLIAASGDIDGDGVAELVLGDAMYGAEIAPDQTLQNTPTGILYAIRSDAMRNGYTVTSADILMRGPAATSTDEHWYPMFYGPTGLGTSLSIAGDVDGDGSHDILTGAPTANPDDDSAGVVYLLPSTPRTPD
jgi:hypothetical protein